MLEPGTLVDDKYRILSEIGHGGMSIVYMARNEKANKTWAIKEVRRSGVINYESVKQGLIVETELLKKLNHDHLPSIIDVIEDDDTFLIVMDYIEGNSLEQTLKEFGAQPQEKVVEWAKQLCDVLGYLHSREPSIIYRDLKPANIMLKPDGNLMLIDFGTAREYKEKNIADTTCLGTVGYAAPEQFGGMGQTDGRTDIYCLGATLYRMVTGMNPSEPPYEIKPIREINPSLSEGLEKIILKCTQRDPEERYQTCAEMMYDLDNYESNVSAYQKKLKRKLGVFITTIICSIIFLVCGITLDVISSEMATDDYKKYIEAAAKTGDYNEKIENYENAINVPDKAGEVDAYLNIIQCYKDNSKDPVLTNAEYSNLVKLIDKNKSSLLKDKDNYANVCFEIGKIIWYYYDYGTSASADDDNQLTRMIIAVGWFDDTLKNCDESFQYKNMAEVYKEIGLFYKDISTKRVEGSDKGIYRPFFDNLNEMLEKVGSNELENDMVRAELYEMCRSALQQYTTKFRGDGVTKQEQMDMYNKVSGYVNKMYDSLSESEKNAKESDDISKEVKLLLSTHNLLQDTLQSIELAYSSQKGA